MGWDLDRLLEPDLSHNSIDTIQSGVFQSLKSLQSLKLDGNILSSVPSPFFASLTKLTHLHLDGNPIGKIQATDVALPKLKELSLVHCGITEFF